MFLIILAIFMHIITKKIKLFGQRIIKYHLDQILNCQNKLILISNQNNDLVFFK